MIEFKYSDTGSIRCPFHNHWESFEAGHIIQPTDPSLVRYPCGYVDGLASVLPRVEPALSGHDRDEMVTELSKRLTRLEERGMPRRTPTAPTPQQPAKKGGVAL